MSKENLLLQYDMFSGELIDTRSESQKKKDKDHSAPQQAQMFKTSEIVQTGGKTKSSYRDWLDVATAPPLVLQIIDTRTTEEIERDLMHEAEQLTASMFDEETPAIVEDQSLAPESPLSVPQPVVVFDSTQHHCQRGLRTRLRAQSIPIRRRSFSM